MTSTIVGAVAEVIRDNNQFQNNLATTLLSDNTGMGAVLLANYCGFKAKQVSEEQAPIWYQHRLLLLRLAVSWVPETDWWVDEHTHGRASWVLIIRVAPVEIAFHLQGSGAQIREQLRQVYLPSAQGRRWCRKLLQEHAEVLLSTYMRNLHNDGLRRALLEYYVKRARIAPLPVPITSEQGQADT